ncbi:hypothetical protein GCM10009854_24280 [Saccharopolyspora halophila]|uniref:Uncharacterized protein n=1 Tax=Saccharopolyspora halophila TaxID=405551 RepID=A0ABN3G8R1_9PSEU
MEEIGDVVGDAEIVAAETDADIARPQLVARILVVPQDLHIRAKLRGNDVRRVHGRGSRYPVTAFGARTRSHHLRVRARW